MYGLKLNGLMNSLALSRDLRVAVRRCMALDVHLPKCNPIFLSLSIFLLIPIPVYLVLNAHFSNMSIAFLIRFLAKSKGSQSELVPDVLNTMEGHGKYIVSWGSVMDAIENPESKISLN